MISEFTFAGSEKGDLLLGNDISEEEDETVDADSIAADLGVDGPDGNMNPPTDEIPENPEVPTEMPATPPLEPEVPPLEPESNPDEVEVDVTSLVKGSEEAKQAADIASHNSELLLKKLADLETKLDGMDAVTAKIEGLEQEIIKRNPTPVEKLEMRSLSSYPYSQKLTDYWSDKEGAYDVMGTDNEKDTDEYTLTKKDVDDDYSETDISRSFGASVDDYEEEDI